VVESSIKGAGATCDDGEAEGRAGGIGCKIGHGMWCEWGGGCGAKARERGGGEECVEYEGEGEELWAVEVRLNAFDPGAC
jgi:hypothetical protein